MRRLTITIPLPVLPAGAAALRPLLMRCLLVICLALAGSAVSAALSHTTVHAMPADDPGTPPAGAGSSAGSSFKAAITAAPPPPPKAPPPPPAPKAANPGPQPTQDSGAGSHDINNGGGGNGGGKASQKSDYTPVGAGGGRVARNLPVAPLYSAVTGCDAVCQAVRQEQSQNPCQKYQLLGVCNPAPSTEGPGSSRPPRSRRDASRCPRSWGPASRRSAAPPPLASLLTAWRSKARARLVERAGIATRP